MPAPAVDRAAAFCAALAFPTRRESLPLSDGRKLDAVLATVGRYTVVIAEAAGESLEVFFPFDVQRADAAKIAAAPAEDRDAFLGALRAIGMHGRSVLGVYTQPDDLNLIRRITFEQRVLFGDDAASTRQRLLDAMLEVVAQGQALVSLWNEAFSKAPQPLAAAALPEPPPELYG